MPYNPTPTCLWKYMCIDMCPKTCTWIFVTVWFMITESILTVPQLWACVGTRTWTLSVKDSRGYILYDSMFMTFWKAKTWGTEIRSMVTRNWGRKKRGLGTEEHEGTLWGDRNILYLDRGDAYTIVHRFQKSELNTRLKRVNFTVCRTAGFSGHLVFPWGLYWCRLQSIRSWGHPAWWSRWGI